jgi:guanine deaminase
LISAPVGIHLSGRNLPLVFAFQMPDLVLGRKSGLSEINMEYMAESEKTKMKEKEFMSQAIELAIENVEKRNGGPFGAVVVKDGKIIARGYNQVTSLNDPTAHAEVVAIRNACKVLNSFQLDGCEIYTSCEPCPMCLGAIYWARPLKVFYACTKTDAAAIHFDDDFIYKEIEKPLEKRSLPFVQLMQAEGLAAFRAWENKTDKIEY